MFIKFPKTTLTLLAIILCCCGISAAASSRIKMKDDTYIKDMEFFNNFAGTVTGNYVWDSNGNTDTNAGWVDVDEIVDGIAIGIQLTALGGGTWTARCEVRIGTNTGVGVVYREKDYTETGTDYFDINSKVCQVRNGYSATGTSTFTLLGEGKNLLK